VAKEKSRSLFDVVADAKRQWEVSEKGHREHFKKLTLLLTQGLELCLALIGPSRVRNHLSEGMHIAALRHTEKVRELCRALSGSVFCRGISARVLM
jgi:hypothetical protein